MRSKTRIYGGKPCKTQLLTELLVAGIHDNFELKKELDFRLNEDVSFNFIKKQKCIILKKMKGETVNNTVKLLPKADKDTIKQAVQLAILSIAEKTKDLKDERVIGDLFSDILHIGAGK